MACRCPSIHLPIRVVCRSTRASVITDSRSGGKRQEATAIWRASPVRKEGRERKKKEPIDVRVWKLKSSHVRLPPPFPPPKNRDRDADLIRYKRELSRKRGSRRRRSKSRRNETSPGREIYGPPSIYRPTGSRTSDYRRLKSADVTGTVARGLSESDLKSLASTRLPLHSHSSEGGNFSSPFSSSPPPFSFVFFCFS